MGIIGRDQRGTVRRCLRDWVEFSYAFLVDSLLKDADTCRLIERIDLAPARTVVHIRARPAETAYHCRCFDRAHLDVGETPRKRRRTTPPALPTTTTTTTTTAATTEPATAISPLQPREIG